MWPSVLLLGLLVSIANFNVTAYSVPTNFGCKNSLISDEWRKAVLRFHNNKRRALAEGKVKTKDGKAAPMAKNMNELLWDCNIETHAFENTCNGVVDQNYYGVTDTFKNKKTCNAAVNTEELLKKWWDESKAIDLTASQSYDATAEQNAPKFSHMAAATAKAFACSYSTCSGSDSKLLCVYEKLQQNIDIYAEAGTTAEICSLCNSALPQGKDCVSSLCQQEYDSPGDIPERTCTAEDGMSNDLQAIAVDMHNYYRRLVGSGWAPDKSGYASPATKMTAVEYDCDTKVGQDSIGKLTKELAATCAPPYQPTQGYSRNYHVEKDLTKSRTEVLKEAIRKWAEQSKLVDLDNGVLFDGDVETYAASFANVVSEQTTKIVCGVTENECQKQGFRVAVCQYDNPIYTSDTVYTAGKTCSRCNALGLKCDNDLGGGLCV